MFKQATLLVVIALALSVNAETVRQFRDGYQPTLITIPGTGDNFRISITSEAPIFGFEDFPNALVVTTGMGQKRSGCDHDVSHYACTNPVQWDIATCGSNGTLPAIQWQYAYTLKSGYNPTVEMILDTSLNEMKRDCPMQDDSAGGGSILVTVMIQTQDGVNRLAAKVWKLDLVFNSRTLATAVMWAEDISGNDLLEISIESKLDLMVDLTSTVVRDFYTYYVGETVLVRHTILTDAPYIALAIEAYISPFENPSEAAQYFWTANETEQLNAVIPLNFKYVQERTNLKEIWFCFDAPVDCLDCFIHSLANVELVTNGGELVPPEARRLDSVRAIKRATQTSVQSLLGEAPRRLIQANSLQSNTQQFQVLEGAPPADNANVASAASAGLGGTATVAAIVGCVALVALFAGMKYRNTRNSRTQVQKIQPETVQVKPMPPKYERCPVDVEADEDDMESVGLRQPAPATANM